MITYELYRREFAAGTMRHIDVIEAEVAAARVQLRGMRS